MDNRQDKIIDEVFRRGLDEGPVTPSPDLWDRIELGMAGEPKKKRGIVFFWQGWAVAATIAFLLSLGYNVYQGGQVEQAVQLAEESGAIAPQSGQVSPNTDGDGVSSDGTPATTSTPDGTSDESNTENGLADAAVNSPESTETSAPMANQQLVTEGEGQGRGQGQGAGNRDRLPATTNTVPNNQLGESIAVVPRDAQGPTSRGVEKSNALNADADGMLANAANGSVVPDPSMQPSSRRRSSNSGTEGGTVPNTTFEPVEHLIALVPVLPQTIRTDELTGREVAFLPFHLEIDKGKWEEGTADPEGTLAMANTWQVGGYGGLGRVSGSDGIQSNSLTQNGVAMANRAEAITSADVNNMFATGVEVGKRLGNHFEVVSGVAYSGLTGGNQQLDNDWSANLDPVAPPPSNTPATRAIEPTAGDLSSGDQATLGDSPGLGGPLAPGYMELQLEPNNDFSSSPDPGTYQPIAEMGSRQSAESTASFTYNFVEIPVMVRYRLGKKKLQYFLASGVSANLLSTYRPSETAAVQTTAGPTQMNLLFSAGLEYQVLKNFGLRFEPMYRHGVLSNDVNITNSAFNTLGLNTGLNFRF